MCNDPIPFFLFQKNLIVFQPIPLPDPKFMYMNVKSLEDYVMLTFIQMGLVETNSFLSPFVKLINQTKCQPIANSSNKE